jgi:uncharacterized protein
MFENANMLVLKLTRDCNLRCDYCYIHNKDAYKGERISYELYQKIIDRICSDKIKIDAKENKESFSLIFHGGEPLLTDKLTLAKMFDYASRQFHYYKINHNMGIQTNLTLLDEELVLLLKKYNVHVGASFDGIKRGNRARTKVLDSKMFEEKFKLIEKYGLEYGILMVVNQENLKYISESTDYLEKHYKIKGFKINYSEDVNSVGNEVKGSDYFEYALKPQIDYYIKNGDQRETNLKQIIKNFIIDSLVVTTPHTTSNCSSKFCGGGMRIIEINPDGTVYLCGRYSKDFEDAYIMSVDDKDFLQLIQTKNYLNFVYNKHKALMNAHCDSCVADYICDHGCMAFHKSKFGEFGIRTDLVCDIFKSIYRYMVAHEVEIIRAFYNKNKNSMGVLELSMGDNIVKIRDNGFTFKRLKDIGIDVKLSPKKYTIILEKAKK